MAHDDHQGLIAVSGDIKDDECEECHRLRTVRWYQDDHSGGFEWCYCRECAYNIRAERRTNAG